MTKPTSRSSRSPATRVILSPSNPGVNADDPPLSTERDRLIQETAYYLAQARGFLPGYELEDWLAAEARIDAASR